MSGIEDFVEICPIHKVHVMRMKVEVIVAENGDSLYRYKCPIPRCRFRTIKRETKEEDEKKVQEFLKSIKY